MGKDILISHVGSSLGGWSVCFRNFFVFGEYVCLCSKHILSNVESASSFEQSLGMAFAITLIIFKNISASIV